MAVTYRAIERYSKRRFKTSAESQSTVLFSSSTSQWPVWSALSSVNDSKNWALRHLSLLFGLSICLRIRFIIREWITLIICGQYFNWLVSAYASCIERPIVILLAVSAWTIKRVLYCYFGWSDVVFATRIRGDHYGSDAEANRSSWSVTVYLIDTQNRSVFRTRQAISDEVDAEPSLKLLCQTRLLGRLQIWRRCPDTDSSCYSLVRELSPMWKREVVTQDTVHDYVSDIVQRQDVGEPALKPPWRIYLVPLACDPSALDDCSSCCLVAQCHRLLSDTIDSAIRRALKTRRRLPASDHYRVPSVQRSMPTGSLQLAPAVSWTKAVARADFIDRVCSLTGATIGELFLAAFSQSLNQCYNQSDLKNSSGIIRIAVDNEEYSLPLGTPLLEDGQLVLAMLKSQRLETLEKMNSYISEPEARHLYREHTSRMHDEPQVSVRMETAAANNDITGIDAMFRWTAPCTLSIPIRLGLWVGHSSVRLGLIQGQHPALVRCPLRVDEIERRLYQLAAGFGVQTGRPLSPHSTPSSSPGCTPPPTPRPPYHYLPLKDNCVCTTLTTRA